MRSTKFQIPQKISIASFGTPCGITSVGVILSLLWLSLAVWSNQLMPVPVLGMLSIQLVAWILVIALWWWYRDKKGLSVKAIIWLSVLMRLPSFYASPIYEDDYYRFLWDGWNFVSEGTPYNGPPADYFDKPEHTEAVQGVLYNVNYPEVPTIYAPICQAFFALGAVVEPLKLWSLRLVMFLVELVIIFLFSRMVPARQLLLFAWCPLLIFESLFQVHPDMLAASFLLLAYFSRKKENHWLLGLFSALALGIKITVLPAIAFLLWPLRKHSVLVFCFTMIAMYSPFLLQGSRADFDGLLVFAREWEFNASLYSLAVPYFQSSVRFVMLGIFTSAFLFVWLVWQRRGALQKEIPQTLVVVYGVLFLVSPVVNSWYLLIILPFVCLASRPWSIAALVVVSLSYVRGQTLPESPLGDFQQPLWLLVTEYTIVIGLAVYSWIRSRIEEKETVNH